MQKAVNLPGIKDRHADAAAGMTSSQCPHRNTLISAAAFLGHTIANRADVVCQAAQLTHSRLTGNIEEEVH